MRRTLLPMAALLLGACAVEPAYEDPEDTATAEGKTVTICHHDHETLDVLPSEASMHLGHGDAYGPCKGDMPTPESE